MALAGLGLSALVMATLALTVGCGHDAKAKAEEYYFRAFAMARNIERDPSTIVRILRGVAYHLDDPERADAYARHTGLLIELDRASQWAAEDRARADAIEANPALYAQTLRCAADIVGERFKLEARSRAGPQPECGHCVGSPSCQSWRPDARIARS